MRFLSLFSGIEAASVAWKPLGWTCVGVAEIESFPCAVLKHHYPDVPNLGDVTKVTDSRIAELGPIDVVIGGSPCQDLSVAGKRAGLAGGRSTLFHEQVRIFRAARHLCGARFLVWENVPGAFSSNAGRDFAVVVGEMAGCRIAVPANGWGNEGVAVGEQGLVEWAVLDAQWFGVAQRRRRVFAVLDAGDWASRGPILLEPESLRGDTAPRREAGQGVAGTVEAGAGKRRHDEQGTYVEGVAPSLAARTRGGGGGLGTDFDCDGGLIAGTLQASGKAAGSATQQDAESGMLVAFGGNNTEGAIDVATACNAHGGSGRMDFESETLLVPIAYDERNVTSVVNRSNPKPGDPCHTLHKPGDTILAFAQNQREEVRENAGGQVAVAFNAYQRTVGDAHSPLTSELKGRSETGVIVPAVAFDARQSDVIQYGEKTGPLDTCGFTMGIRQAMQVRRLTPRECERLQGFPDDYTLIPMRGKPAADGPRYKSLGNSFAEPVIRWIGRRIEAVSTTPDMANLTFRKRCGKVASYS